MSGGDSWTKEREDRARSDKIKIKISAAKEYELANGSRDLFAALYLLVKEPMTRTGHNAIDVIKETLKSLGII